MRSMILSVAAAALVGCAAQPVAPMRTAQAQQRLDQLIVGKVAGAPLSCLSSHRAKDMIIIDDETIAFRQGSGQTYVNHLQGGGCPLAGGFNTLVTRSSGGLGLCRGEIAQVADLQSGFTVGSCVLGDFIPYGRPRA